MRFKKIALASCFSLLVGTIVVPVSSSVNRDTKTDSTIRMQLECRCLHHIGAKPPRTHENALIYLPRWFLQLRPIATGHEACLVILLNS